MQDSGRVTRTLALALLVAVVGVVAYKARDARSADGRIIVTAALDGYQYRSQGRTGHVSDMSEESWLVRDRYGKTIGRLFLACRWVTQTQRVCVGAYNLPWGALTLSGNSTSQFGGVFAVTGGTGRYRDAGGEARFVTTGLGRMITTITLV
jgi:hypothetical protein